MAGDEANGRVTTSQFYAAQLETQKMIGEVRSEVRDMKDEIMSELKPLIVITANNETRSKNNEKELERQRNRSNALDLVIAAATAIGTFLGISK